ncbi:hypothetical protein [Saccharopolyspora taberi]|uniref:Uncharacterized protein n=1 Tax=Saccharopolyspora taberi TaxID=60895 RepID=A0ABN3UZR1_9PSEU
MPTFTTTVRLAPEGTDEHTRQVDRMARAMFNRNHPGRDYDADAGEAERELHRQDARVALDALAGGAR